MNVFHRQGAEREQKTNDYCRKCNKIAEKHRSVNIRSQKETRTIESGEPELRTMDRTVYTSWTLATFEQLTVKVYFPYTHIHTYIHTYTHTHTHTHIHTHIHIP
jgi:hypothetical protein